MSIFAKQGMIASILRSYSTGFNIVNAPKQVDTLGIGSFIKILFRRAPPKTNKNPAGQIGLSMIRVWGQPLGYYKGVVNEAMPLQSRADQVDKVLIEMGLPISDSLVNWNHAEKDSQSYTYAPVDEETRTTLIDMERLRDKAFKNQDYELLKNLVRDLKIVFEVSLKFKLEKDWE